MMKRRRGRMYSSCSNETVLVLIEHAFKCYIDGNALLLVLGDPSR